MQLVEQHVIDRNDPRYTVIDAAAFASKNLYNAALYLVRQSFIGEHRYLNYHEVQKRMQSHEAYKALPAKVSQHVLMQLHHDWESFFKARAAFEEEPSKLPITVKTKQDPPAISQVRIVPRKGFYVVEVVYEQAPVQAPVNPAFSAGLDLGITNLATVASNKPGCVPVVVNGRPVKSINQFYNKRRAELQKKLGHPGTTRRMERLTNTRNRRIDLYMHTASRKIIDWLVQEGIGTLVIGKNDGWKQEVEMGKRNNQNFVQIPYARFIAMLTYKAELVGITIKVTEESYTSKASLLDLDPLPVRKSGDETKHTFSGKRVKRGLYQASNGRYI